MKEQIYTIPLNEAFDKDSECPFCELQKKLDAEIMDYILGPSYMEEDIREQTNKLGFCKRHYSKIFAAHNRLGAALMIHTHLLEINKNLDKAFEDEQNGGKGSLFKKPKNDPICEYTDSVLNGCYACQREETRMNSYVYTFFYLWKTEPEFVEKVKSCKGFCLEHMSRIISDSRKHLNAAQRQALMNTIIPLQKQNLERITEDVDWFIKKFDYRFQDEPWKNSKDAVERAILKLSGVLDK